MHPENNQPANTPAPRAWTAAPIVSVVVPTFNRFSRLRRCIDNIRQCVTTPHEIIVVDGTSTDGSREWLRDQSDLHVILESRREGAVRAFNKGFRAAAGEFVTWLNDDAYYLPGAVEAAVATLKRTEPAGVGMVAFYHGWHSERNVLDTVHVEGGTYSLCHVRGTPYANFGLLRRTLLAEVGYADERFHFFGFDPDLSLTLQFVKGLKVVGCRDAIVGHDELHDDRKLGDLPQGDEDNRRLFEKWPQLPDRDAYPDPAPAYRRMVDSLENGCMDAPIAPAGA